MLKSVRTVRAITNFTPFTQKRMTTDHRAFTLIEMMIVTVIVAILALGLLFAFQGTKDKADFSNQQTQVVNLIQEARGLSLSNLMVGDEIAQYYLLSVQRGSVTLSSVAESGTLLEVGMVTFEGDVSVPRGTTFDTYYFPPYGDVCFSEDCAATDPTEDTFTLTDGVNESDITITIYGGYPEVVDN